MLHWKYGTARETTRLNDPKHLNRFMTNNFVISKSAFEKIDFTGGWTGYGYEDTWMGIQLEAMRVPVIFVDNPVMHDGVETSIVFIRKSEEALMNLKKLSTLVAPQILVKHVRLYGWYRTLKLFKLLWLLRLGKNLQTSIDRNLHSCNPSLLQFDFYRLRYFAEIKTTHA